MKITHIIPALTRGGAERVVVDLANAASRAGHDVTILAAFPVDSEQPLYAIDPAVRPRFMRTKGPVRAVYPWLVPWLLGNRAWLLDQDIVHCHLTFGALAGSIVRMMRGASGRKRPKVVETSHAVGMPIPPGRRRFLAAMAANRDGYVLMAEDPFWRQFIADHPTLPVRVIPNGTRLDHPVPSKEDREHYRETIGIPADAGLVVGTIGRLSSDRNPAAIVATFAAIARQMGEGVHFLMGGEGPLSHQLQAQAAAAGLAGRVHFPGLVVDAALARSLMDLYVSVNVGPITGLAGLEACASGLPVVALQARQDYGAGASDWIWSDPEPEAVATEVTRLLRSNEDRQTLGARQRAHVRQHYSVESAAKAYEAFYLELLAG